MRTIDETMIAPRYRGHNIRAAIEVARRIPRLARMVENFERTGHHGCVNAVMDAAICAANGRMWLVFYQKETR